MCLEEVPVTWYILFFSASPILTFAMLPGKKPRETYLYSALALAGTVIFLNPTNVAHYPSAIALLYLLVSVTSWVLLTRLMIAMHKAYSDMEISFILNFCNFSGALALMLNHELVFAMNATFSLLALIAIAVRSPIAAYLFSVSLRASPTFVIAAQYLELVFGSIIGIALFHEIPTLYEYAGASLIIVSLLGTTISLQKAQAKNARAIEWQ